MWWHVLIIYTALSTLWATNTVYATYGIFTTLLLYACYKSFENIDLESKNIKNCIYWAAMICLLSALLVEFLAVYEYNFSVVTIGDQAADLQKMAEKNLHVIGSIIVLLLPFVIFNENKSTKIIAPILLSLSLILSYFSESVQVTILVCFLCVIYILYSIPYRRSIKYLVLVGFMGIIGAALYTASTTQNGSHVINEIYQQNDRLLIWKNSINLFTESPIVGHGKNNWAIEYGKYGYNGYDTFKLNKFNFKSFVHPHNSIISIICEGGIIGILIYTYLFVLPCLRIFNERLLLSKLEIAAICMLFMFLLLSLIYGSIINFYDNFKGLNIIAVIGLAILSKTSNRSVYLGQIPSKISSGLTILFAVPCILYFNAHIQTSHFFNTLATQQQRQNYTETENPQVVKYSKKSNYLNADQAIILAKNSLNQDKITHGKSILSKALKNDPYNVELLTHLAAVQLNDENHHAANKLANKAHQLNKNLIDPQILIAKSEFLLRNDATAASKFCDLKNKIKRFSKANQKTKPNKNLIVKSKELRLFSKKIKELETFIQDENIAECN